MSLANLTRIFFGTNHGSQDKAVNDTPPFRYEPDSNLCFINLPALRQNDKSRTAAPCIALGHVISLINGNYITVEVDCGKENPQSREVNQTATDAVHLTSATSLETVINRTGKQVEIKKYHDDLPDGKHTVVVFKVID